MSKGQHGLTGTYLADLLHVVAVHNDGVHPEGLNSSAVGLHVVLQRGGVGLAQPAANSAKSD